MRGLKSGHLVGAGRVIDSTTRMGPKCILVWEHHQIAHLPGQVRRISPFLLGLIYQSHLGVNMSRRVIPGGSRFLGQALSVSTALVSFGRDISALV